MIATCKFCQLLIKPGTVLHGVPAKELARIPPQQLEVMQFSQAVTQHLQSDHPEYMRQVQAMVGNVVSTLTLCTVDPTGDGAESYRILTQADKELLLLILGSAPNPPDPAAVQDVHSRVQAAQAAPMVRGTGLVDPAGNPVGPVIRLGGSLDGSDVN